MDVSPKTLQSTKRKTPLPKAAPQPPKKRQITTDAAREAKRSERQTLQDRDNYYQAAIQDFQVSWKLEIKCYLEYSLSYVRNPKPVFAKDRYSPGFIDAIKKLARIKKFEVQLVKIQLFPLETYIVPHISLLHTSQIFFFD